jgi:hypothetical protein
VHHLAGDAGGGEAYLVQVAVEDLGGAGDVGAMALSTSRLPRRLKERCVSLPPWMKTSIQSPLWRSAITGRPEASAHSAIDPSYSLALPNPATSCSANHTAADR